jgi:hypothetical protein
VEKTLFSATGIPTAYFATDYQQSIYLWDGSAVAYLFEGKHVYGMNGHHLGWFVQEILYNSDGERIGFTAKTCPVCIAKEPPRSKRLPRDEVRPRWNAPAFPNLTDRVAKEDLGAFLRRGQVKPSGSSK